MQSEEKELSEIAKETNETIESLLRLSKRTYEQLEKQVHDQRTTGTKIIKENRYVAAVYGVNKETHEYEPAGQIRDLNKETAQELLNLGYENKSSRLKVD